MVGRLLSYWEGNFSGAMLNFGRVIGDTVHLQRLWGFHCHVSFFWGVTHLNIRGWDECPLEKHICFAFQMIIISTPTPIQVMLTPHHNCIVRCLKSAPWKINVEHNNGCLEDDFPLPWVIFGYFGCNQGVGYF